jgi:aminotransferase EvaB
MTIRGWDYRREYEAEREEILAGIDKVLRSGSLVLGPGVKAFEEAFAAWLGVAQGIGVNSGTDALFLALKALGIGPGDEVITVANTAIPTVSAIVATGAAPKFVDIDPATYLMDASLLAAAVTPRTRCIVPVHLFGQCVEMATVTAAARQHGLRVVEDCAQCHGASQAGRKAGSMSDAAIWSFYPTKVLGTYGDGGMVTTGDAAIAQRVRRLRMYGNEGTYYAVEHGYNSRLDELHAEILLRKLPRVEGYIERRRQLAARYGEQLAGSGLTLPAVAPGNGHVFHQYVVRHRDRDAILRKLAAQDIHLGVHYPWPIHAMKAYAGLGAKEGDLPHTEAAAKEIFSLPMYPTLADAEQDQVCQALRDALR